MKKLKTFTLIELLVVIAIIAILASVASGSYDATADYIDNVAGIVYDYTLAE